MFPRAPFEAVALSWLIKVVEDVGPPRWPKRQDGHDEDEKQYGHRHLHDAEARRVLGHEPACHKSRRDQ
jgi:hypothetical protein